MKSRRFLMILCLMSTLILSACGGDDASEGVARIDDTQTTTISSDNTVVAQVSNTQVASPSLDQADSFITCMRKHNFEVARPALDDEGRIDVENLRATVSSNPQFDLADSRTQQALRDCSPELMRQIESQPRDDEEITTGFTRCMRDEGFSVPDPKLNADGTVDTVALRESVLSDPKFNWQDPKTQQILQKCLPLLQGATFAQEETAEEQVEFQDNLLKFAECLRQDGVQVSDPDFSGGTRQAIGSMFQGIDTQEPAIQESIATCRQVYFGSQ